MEMNGTQVEGSIDASLGLTNGQLETPALTPVTEEPPINKIGTERTDDIQEITSSDHAETNDEHQVRAASTPAERPAFIKQASSSIYRRRTSSNRSNTNGIDSRYEVLKLPLDQLDELTNSPESLPLRQLSSSSSPVVETPRSPSDDPRLLGSLPHSYDRSRNIDDILTLNAQEGGSHPPRIRIPASTPLSRRSSHEQGSSVPRPRLSRAVSVEEHPKAKHHDNHRVFSPSTKQTLASGFEDGLGIHTPRERRMSGAQALPSPPPSPMPETIPLPPFSMPTYLHLELSADRPSPLYLHRSASADIAYEPSRLKFQRLLHFLFLPLQLERVLFFGTLTCLDAWLYSFTILPLRFLRACWIITAWFSGSAWGEVTFIASYIYGGLGRLWRRKNTIASTPQANTDPVVTKPSDVLPNGKHVRSTTEAPPSRPRRFRDIFSQHLRMSSAPSQLQSSHKADLLQGLLIIFTCTFLLQFDASRIYHGIRGQSAVKLYVIYNMLEVCDRLFSAIGQDIIECLFSSETLERKPNGRSKIIAPFWMFLIALVYTIFHSGSFLYQVITLNVAVNAYSNALLTLLLSNQFVEIKGAVFKKFEKENLFQLTCADVVERFQLWIMLLIIALRNVAELGGLAVTSGGPDPAGGGPSSSGPTTPNATAIVDGGRFSILPDSFTVLPLPTSAQLQPLTPFVLVLGSEMLVDWLKHAYITKFNAYKPRSYARFLDVLAKDYYSNAFGSHNVVRRLGLPVIPLVCLFARAMIQTYHMFLATNVSPSLNMSSSTSLALDEATAAASPALVQIDHIFRNALGRSSFGGGVSSSTSWFTHWTLDDIIAFTTMVLFFSALFLLLLAFKLILGMVLLSLAGKRYRGMKRRENEKVTEPSTKRLGGWGTVEVGDDRRRIIYDGDEDRLKRLKEKEKTAREREEDVAGHDRLDSVDRYDMVSKRIW